MTTIYNYDVVGNLISESEADGTPLRDIVCMNGERVAMRLYGLQAGWYYFVNDHLGTPQKVVDSSGVVVWQAAYLPFGKAQVLSGSSVTNNFRFPGQYYDEETELHQNWHRYYMPGKGRYLTPDSIGLAGGINLYTYVLNNSVNHTDSEGLMSSVSYFSECLPGDDDACTAICRENGPDYSGKCNRRYHMVPPFSFGNELLFLECICNGRKSKDWIEAKEKAQEDANKIIDKHRKEAKTRHHESGRHNWPKKAGEEINKLADKAKKEGKIKEYADALRDIAKTMKDRDASHSGGIRGRGRK